MGSILVVDDDEHLCEAITMFLSKEGHDPVMVGNAEDALKRIVESPPDLVLMDVRMPGTDGLEALRRIRQVDRDIYVVMMTAYSTSQTSIEAMRMGAFDHLVKPFDLDVLKACIDRALESLALGRQVQMEPAETAQDYLLVNLVGKTDTMQEVYKRIGLLAANEVPALLLGEPGVGKHLVAKTIHFNSRRKDRSFVAVDCRSLPGEVLRSELFGDAVQPPGAETGEDTHGKLAAANGGTLFLDNVDALPPPVQSRFLELGVAASVPESGGGADGRSDIRIIAASERDLGESVRGGTFNEKLFHLLRTMSIRLPSLRDRLEDLPELVNHFIARCNAELGSTIRGVDGRVARLLQDYSWPGNVTELETVIRRAAIFARGEVIVPADIGESLQESDFTSPRVAESALEQAVRVAIRQRLSVKDPSPGVAPFHEIVGLVERTLIREALRATSGNQLRASVLLGLNRATLRKKMRS